MEKGKLKKNDSILHRQSSEAVLGKFQVAFQMKAMVT